MKNLEKVKDMRTRKQKKNELSMSSLHKMLQDDDACTDDCIQAVVNSIDEEFDYDEEYLDSADCDNSEVCAYIITGAKLVCGAFGTNDPDQCVLDTIGDDCTSCVNPERKKLPKLSSDCADCFNQTLAIIDWYADMAETEEDGCDENNCAKRAMGLMFVCGSQSYPEMDGTMQCVVDNAGDDCHTCACNVWSFHPDGDHTHPDSCDSLHRRNKKTSRKNKKKIPSLF